MSKRTAVAAPPAEPFEELFAAIDAMNGADLRRFLRLLKERFDITGGPVDVTVRFRGPLTWPPTGTNSTTWQMPPDWRTWS